MGAWRRAMGAALAVGLVGAGAARAADPIGTVQAVTGEVLVSPDAGKPFAPATVGMALYKGGTVVALEEGAATLALKGKGPVEVADNASLRLEQVAGEFSAVTGVRAPVLFLFPTGRSDPWGPGTVAVTFGLNHNLDTVQGVTHFHLYALHEDAEDELESDDPAEVLDASVRIASFNVREKPSTTDYTWYSLASEVALADPGEYTLFVAAVRDDAVVRLGQSALLFVQGEGQ